MGLDKLENENYTERDFPKGRCTECGNEEDNKIIERKSKSVPPVTPNKNAKCGECGHVGSAMGFNKAYNWERLSQEEREKRKQTHTKKMDMQAEAEHDAGNISRRREP